MGFDIFHLHICIISLYKVYSPLSASTGFNLEALFAGYIPKTIPVNRANMTVNAIISYLIIMDIPSINAPIKDITMPKITPRILPDIVSIKASIKNSLRISPLHAPMAFLIPISRFFLQLIQA